MRKSSLTLALVTSLVIGMLTVFAIGCSGSEGLEGPQGPSGPAGVAGERGPAGDTGPAGTDGLAGAKGNTGAAGPAGAKGDTGPAGIDGPPGVPGLPGAQGNTGPQGPAGTAGADGAAYVPTALDVAAAVQPESCAVCHEGAGDEKHQSFYDDYADASTLALTIDSVASVADGAGAFNATMTFTIMKDGLPYIDADGLPSLEQKRFYAVTYDSATRAFDNSKSFSNPVALGNGQYSVTATGITYDLNSSNGQAYAYIADGPLHTEQPAGSHVHLYDDVASGGLAVGDVATYESAANVAGCEKCHGAPYMKHGYRDPVVTGLSDFASCKSCHYDTRTGGHQDWQVLVEDPARFVELTAESEATGTRFRDLLTDEEKAKYAYTANVMNDTHMAHAMEFPYPQSMSTCATCHEDKLDVTLTDANFNLATCKSCHPVNGPAEGTDPHRAPALAAVIPHAWADDTDCSSCHATGGIAPVFSTIHTGYDEHIYADAAGTRYSDIFTVSVDDVSLSGNDLTIKFSATENGDVTPLDVSEILPTVLVGLYGYDTKDFIVAAHGRDADRNRLLEFPIDGTTTNPRFEVVSAAGGSWEVIADLSMWADMIADGTIKRAEIGVMPDLRIVVGERDSRSNGETDDTAFAVDAPSRTFDFNANAFDDDFYSDIVKVTDGCNTCHDALATTFHSPNRGGNIAVCRTCHVGLSGGSHLELQSRSIDSYVHAVHSFQDFDIGDVDFEDPVESEAFGRHQNHVFPNFTIRNCQACHNEGTFNVPDQSKSMPGRLSAADDVTTANRNIGAIPGYVSGPATRACGACHRAQLIKADDAAGLAAFNQHTNAGGYLVADDDGVLEAVIDKIMGMFK